MKILRGVVEEVRETTLGDIVRIRVVGGSGDGLLHIANAGEYVEGDSVSVGVDVERGRLRMVKVPIHRNVV